MEIDFSAVTPPPAVTLQLLQTVADAAEKTPLSDVVKNTLADAGMGALVGVGTGAALTTLAVAIGADLATASTVAVSAGAAIASGAGAGTALGSTLGPIGAAVGVIVGLFAGMLSLVDVSHYGDPAYGTEVGMFGRAYLQSHPINPILSIQIENDPVTTLGVRSAFDQLDWAPFEWSLGLAFKFADGKATLRSDTPSSKAIRTFLADMAHHDVPQKVAYNVIALYCDFIARVRLAEYSFVLVHPGPVGDLKNERSGNDYPWMVADRYAALAFLGVNETNFKQYLTAARGTIAPGYPAVTWATATAANLGFSVDAQSKDPNWPDVSSTPFFKDIEGALRYAFDHPAPLFFPGRIPIQQKGSVMHEALEFAKEKAEEAVEVVYKDGKVTKVGKGVGIAAGILVVLKVLAGRRA